MRLPFALLLVLASDAGWAQQRVQVTRQDQASAALRVYTPAKATPCPPLALISPGAGGSEDGYRYLAASLQGAGWRAIVMGHKESGSAVLVSEVLHAGGLRDGLLHLTTNAAAYEARYLDIAAALGWAAASCKAPKVVLLGHSMGAATVMMEAGARNKLGVRSPDRFDAYVALSPQGPGSIFPEKAWSGIRKPVLILTGTKDTALEGSWETRALPFDSLPPGCKWLGVVDDATHMNFAGIGISSSTEKATLLEVKAFLAGILEDRCGSPIPGEGLALKNK